MARFRGSALQALLLLACAGCAAPEEAEAPPSPRRAACAGEARQMQGACSPDLLRTQGPDCAVAANHLLEHCRQE